MGSVRLPQLLSGPGAGYSIRFLIAGQAPKSFRFCGISICSLLANYIFFGRKDKEILGGKILRSGHSRWGGIWLIGAGCFLRTGVENVSLLATGKTCFRENVSTLVTEVALCWVIFICKEGLYCLLIRTSFQCCGYGKPCIIEDLMSAHCLI